MTLFCTTLFRSQCKAVKAVTFSIQYRKCTSWTRSVQRIQLQTLSCGPASCAHLLPWKKEKKKKKYIYVYFAEENTHVSILSCSFRILGDKLKITIILLLQVLRLSWLTFFWVSMSCSVMCQFRRFAGTHYTTRYTNPEYRNFNFINALQRRGKYPHTVRGQHEVSTRWFKYDRDKLWLIYTKIVPVIFEPPCIFENRILIATEREEANGRVSSLCYEERLNIHFANVSRVLRLRWVR
jgi:hypothetical protein